MWTYGVLIGLPLLMLITATAVGVIIWDLFYNTSSRGPGLLFTMVGLIIFCSLIFGVGYYPYGDDYHRWKPREGVVTDITSTIYDSNYVVVIDSEAMDCIDTRCALIKPGDYVDLTCIRYHEHGGDDGLQCYILRRVSKDETVE